MMVNGRKMYLMFEPDPAEIQALARLALAPTIERPKPTRKVRPEPERMLRIDTVMHLTGLSRTTIWRMERDGRFPKHRVTGKRATGWVESEVQGWLAQRTLVSPAVSG